MKEGYAICFNEWALDKEINGELGLLLIISSLSAETGYCYASNEYLANLFNTTEITISRKIHKLKNKNYITIEYEKRGAEVKNRFIRLTKLLTDDYQNCKPTINKNVKENNTSINNTSTNKKEIYKERFKKPTLEEVNAYCLERQNGIDASSFIDFYESKGWKVGKTPMKDWKAAVRTWERNTKTKQKSEPEWFYKDLDKEDTTLEEQEELDKLLSSMTEG